MHCSLLKLKIMQTEKILQSDLLDIIFENKNKSYGAYALRKFYNNRLYKAFGAMVLIAVVLCSFTLFKPEVKTEVDFITTTCGFLPEVKQKDKNKPVEPKKENKPAAKQKTPTATTAFTNPKITTNPHIEPLRNLDPGTNIGITDNKVPGGILPKVGDLPLLGKDTTTVVGIVKPPVDVITPNATADVMPAFPGGMAAFRKFLEKNLQNPEVLEEGQKISVKIKFIVGYDGKLKGFETVEDGGAVFNEEVLRVLKKMPNWIPGKIAGENVSVFYTIPVRFETNGE
jgi:periplasmic protein TonB